MDPFEVLTVVDAGDANIVPAWIERGHAMIYRKVREVAGTGAIPIILGGDHSITWPAATAVAETRRPGSIGIVHFDAHADTAADGWGVLASHGTPMRRLIESGAVRGSNFVQVGLRGYWPPKETFAWMQEQGLRYHFMTEIEERGAEAVIADAIAEALDGPDSIYLSIDIDVIDPGMAPGTGTPEPGGMLTREVLRAIRQIVGAVDLAGMDIVEVAPPYDQAETTAMAANRCALEAISAPGRPPPGRRPRALGGLTPSTTSTAAALARLYDLDLIEDPGDLDLYLALAERTGGPVLELAAGSGRLAVPLAAAGNRVTAVDLDPAMLARARAFAAREGVGEDELTFVEADLHRPAPARGGPVRPRVHRAELADDPCVAGRPAAGGACPRGPPRARWRGGRRRLAARMRTTSPASMAGSSWSGRGRISRPVCWSRRPVRPRTMRRPGRCR